MRLDHFPHLEVDAPKAPPTAEEIAGIETAVGATLPPDLLDFLSAANGESSTSPSSFRRRGGLILHELEVERRLKDLRPGLLPIGADGGTSVLYVDLAPERYGRIVAYVEGLPGWDGTPEGCFVDLAPTLAAYLSALYLNTVDESKRGG
ncbi:MAG: SMI1/KNR4 family protein [Holophagales bacterium]|nr:SMI1/KNR4 family protein [Holophagales bacterium]